MAKRIAYTRVLAAQHNFDSAAQAALNGDQDTCRDDTEDEDGDDSINDEIEMAADDLIDDVMDDVRPIKESVRRPKLVVKSYPRCGSLLACSYGEEDPKSYSRRPDNARHQKIGRRLRRQTIDWSKVEAQIADEFWSYCWLLEIRNGFASSWPVEDVVYEDQFAA